MLRLGFRFVLVGHSDTVAPVKEMLVPEEGCERGCGPDPALRSGLHLLYWSVCPKEDLHIEYEGCACMVYLFYLNFLAHTNIKFFSTHTVHVEH